VGWHSLLPSHVYADVFGYVYPYNIMAGIVGGMFYLTWSIRVGNKPQLVTNVVALTICCVGLFKAFG